MAYAAITRSRHSTKSAHAISGASETTALLTPAQRVTAQVSAILERGVRPWVKPWDNIARSGPLALPLRSCGTPYRGMNDVAVWAATLERGFKSRHWFTFKQAVALKSCVRKGERGSYVVFYTELGAKDDNDGDSETRCILRGYTVFNSDQIDGLPPQFYASPETEAIPDSPTQEDEAHLSALFTRIPVTIRYSGNRAFYSIAADVVQLPPREAFRDYTQVFAPLAHETAHWTRHPTRLDRDFGQTRFAELASPFIGAHIGLPADHLEDHASYIGGRLKALGDNPSAFLQAASKAQAAADWVLGETGYVRNWSDSPTFNSRLSC